MARGIAIFVAAFAIYTATALFIFHRTHSPQLAYFDHLAAAFLRGELYLVAPPANYDLTLHNGRWVVPFPPLPALLMLPFVALFGVGGFNTALFSAAIAALNVSLVYAMLRALAARGWSRLGRGDALWLTALFGWGSTHWLLATIGTVWFVSQICMATFVLLAVLVAISIRDIRWAAIGAGAALAVAMLARPHIAVVWPMLISSLMQRTNDEVAAARRNGNGGFSRLLTTSLLPMIAAVVVLLLYNLARFGNLFDFGYITQNVTPGLRSDLHTFGQFSLHYWARNAWAMLAALPTINAHGGWPAIDPQGLSLLLTMPALVYLTQAIKVRRARLVMIGVWSALALTLFVLLSYYNTGGAQFGYRFSLDFLPEILVLLACALPSVSRPMRVLIVIGVAVNAYGVVWFTRFAGI